MFSIITAILIASGFSKRMKQDKLLMDFHGKTVIEHSLLLIKDCSFSEVLVITRNDFILSKASEMHFKPIINENPEMGKSNSIKLGVLNSNEKNAFMFFVGDQPLLDTEIILTMRKKFEENPFKIIVPLSKSDKKSGNPIIFPNSYRNELLNLEGEEGGKKIINKNITRVLYVTSKNKFALMDIDTIEDYEFLKNLNL